MGWTAARMSTATPRPSHDRRFRTVMVIASMSRHYEDASRREQQNWRERRRARALSAEVRSGGYGETERFRHRGTEGTEVMIGRAPPRWARATRVRDRGERRSQT